MAFNKAPYTFFGPGYATVPGEVSFGTVNGIGSASPVTSFSGDSADNTLITDDPHGLAVGDIVVVGDGSAGVLPSGLSASALYYVRTVPTATSLTLALSSGGEEVSLISDGDPGNVLSTAYGPLNEVSDVAADEATGDWRKVVIGLIDMISRKWTRTPTGDRPSKLFINKTYGVSGDQGSVVVTYTIRVTLAPQAVGNIADE